MEDITGRIAWKQGVPRSRDIVTRQLCSGSVLFPTTPEKSVDLTRRRWLSNVALLKFPALLTGKADSGALWIPVFSQSSFPLFPLQFQQDF